MDEDRKEQRMEYAQEREDVAEDQMEETRGARREYRDGPDVFVEEPVDEDVQPSELATSLEEESERASMDKELVPLLGESDAEQFRIHWQDIQTNFVDDPRHSVESADDLVARVINRITENFANERDSLEEQWNRGEEVSTEDLRIAIKRYRSFFNRLLTLETMGAEENR